MLNFREFYLKENDSFVNITSDDIQKYFDKNEKHLGISEKVRVEYIVNILNDISPEYDSIKSHIEDSNLQFIPTDQNSLKELVLKFYPKNKYIDDEMYAKRVAYKIKFLRSDFGDKITIDKIDKKIQEEKQIILNKIKEINTAINDSIKYLRTKYSGKDLKIDTKPDYFISSLILPNEGFYEEKVINPVILYISNVNDEYGDTGISVDRINDKIELFEPNDESSEETYKIVQFLTEDPEKEVKVFASHNSELLMKIKEEKKVPVNLYVSPDQKYASGYYDIKGTRDICSFIIKNKYLRKESEVDWKISQEAPIRNFKYEVYR